MQRFYNATIVDPDSSARPLFHKSEDLSGKIFGRLTVLEFAGRGKRKLLVWKCRCECGTICTAYGHVLRNGAKKSCGCAGSQITSARSTTHGMTNSITYKSWRSMRSRCERPHDISYPRYGGRGVSVCDRWKTFENFLADIGERPSKDHQIERIDNNGNYEPSNCRWATRKDQARNRRSQTLLTYKGETLCVAEWAERLGIHRGRLQNRINLNWSVERIIEEPIRARKQLPKLRLVEWNGQSKTIAEWAKCIDIPENALRQRFALGWTVERAMTQPHKQRRQLSL